MRVYLCMCVCVCRCPLCVCMWCLCVWCLCVHAVIIFLHCDSASKENRYLFVYMSICLCIFKRAFHPFQTGTHTRHTHTHTRRHTYIHSLTSSKSTNTTWWSTSHISIHTIHNCRNETGTTKDEAHHIYPSIHTYTISGTKLEQPRIWQHECQWIGQKHRSEWSVPSCIF